MKKLFIVMLAMLPVAVRAQTEKPRYTKKEKEVINKCQSIATDKLDQIMGTMIATGVISGISASANTFSSVTNAVEAVKQKRDSQDADNKMGIATLVATGVGTTGGVVSAGMAGGSLAEMVKIIEDVEACQDGLNEL